MTADQGRGGVLLGSDEYGSAAWVGLRLAPARRLKDHRGYAGLPEPQRWSETGAAELAWLAARTADGGGVRFELRHTAREGLLHSVLLARAGGPTPQAAETAARQLAARMAQLPPHVQCRAIDDRAELSAELNSLDSNGGPPECVDLREFGKRVEVRPIRRTDSTRANALIATPLGPAGRPWEPVWAELARQERPTALSVCLEPTRLPPAVEPVLHQFAAEYQRLATPRPGNPVWGGAQLGDPSAEAGRAFFADAVHRYLGPCFRLRVTLAAAGPLPTGLAELVADQLGPEPSGSSQSGGGRPGGAAVLTPGGAAVLTPSGRDRPYAWRNLTQLRLDPLPDGHHRGLDPSLWTEIEALLAVLVDRYEAAAAFRLPYEVGGRPALFAEPGPPARPQPAQSSATTASSGSGDTTRPVFD
ncbi:hypothetical protein [Kitasatospora sp. GP82]|uniref:hypothetical protein n=1 Tax=Kitasatospora sp. GP82 TaxID=3035089 RepID=UPI002474F66C|nr:hypothetical protein [Kitasatospora sp. GP82]MDH6126043.1 hypothetical protein [Kitasatospora sp. GP82]